MRFFVLMVMEDEFQALIGVFSSLELALQEVGRLPKTNDFSGYGSSYLDSLQVFQMTLDAQYDGQWVEREDALLVRWKDGKVPYLVPTGEPLKEGQYYHYRAGGE